jgi:membrane fusion protein, multidrug efflux system
MSLKSGFWTILILGCACVGFAVYSPERIEGFSPRAAALARTAHDNAEIYVRMARDKLPLGAQASKATDAEKPQAQPTNPPVPVEAQSVQRKDFPVVLNSLGQVTAYNTVTVKARIDGQITKIGFTEGQMVRQGDLLAEIDARPFQAVLDQAQAKKQQDEANLTNAKLDLARYSTLVKQSFASQQQVDTQNSMVNQLTAQIAADTAAIDSARVNLSYTRISAPLTGRVGFRLVDEGNMVAASQQTGIVMIAELQPISVIFTAPEEQVGEINDLMRAGKAKVVAKSTDGVALATGVLEVVDNQIDPATGTVRLKARFGNEDNKLWPGLAVIAELTLGADKDAVVLPTAAIQHSQKGLFVYVVGADNTVESRPIKVAHENEQEASLASGLKEGERIVTAGQALLRPGATVAVQSADQRS